MKKIVSLCAAAALLLASCSESRKAGKIAVIPAPVHMESGLGDFILDKATVVAYPAGDSVLARAGGMISETLGATFGTALALSPDTLSGAIVLERPETPAGLKPEGYRMAVSPDRIAIETNDYNGAFYALQTLLQLLPAEVYSAGDNGPAENVFDDGGGFIIPEGVELE